MRTITFLIIATFILTGTTSTAVMQPEMAIEGTGLPNSLGPKNLGQQVKEVSRILPEVEFLLFAPIVSDYPYVAEDKSLDEQALIRLSALFNSAFHQVPRDKYVSYRNIFYGYDDTSIRYDLAPGKKRKSGNEVFDNEIINKQNFVIHLAKDLKRNAVLDRMARLAALMTLNMQQSMISILGGPGVMREFYPKVNWTGQIYAGYLLWDIVLRLPEDLLRSQLHKLSAKGNTPLLAQLSELDLATLTNVNINWLMYWLEPPWGQNEKYGTDILALATHLLDGYFLVPSPMNWEERNFDNLSAAMTAPVESWWKSVPTDKRFRILHEAHANKDAILESIIAGNSIILRKCDALLTSRH